MKKKGRLSKISLLDIANKVDEDWKSTKIADINDQVMRLSVLNRDFHWHTHNDSDEAFYVIQGRLEVDFEGHTEVLGAGDMLVVPQGTLHRTRADIRTVTLCFHSSETEPTGDVASSKPQ
ncbi:cupin domain-containing protein [Salidesulfovibrio brasiliensis]|uniref:cupin domain-containing protein n=1 Tax=Salidesulfovibrio brasiliensis TaxID=221711 RepID=UPI0006CF2EFA|nr:cupin domain-containing protein [Salidesulfovibrio brasiliensis]